MPPEISSEVGGIKLLLNFQGKPRVFRYRCFLLLLFAQSAGQKKSRAPHGPVVRCLSPGSGLERFSQLLFLFFRQIGSHDLKSDIMSFHRILDLIHDSIAGHQKQR